jgi:hypothetical protein
MEFFNIRSENTIYRPGKIINGACCQDRLAHMDYPGPDKCIVYTENFKQTRPQEVPKAHET